MTVVFFNGFQENSLEKNYFFNKDKTQMGDTAQECDSNTTSASSLQAV